MEWIYSRKYGAGAVVEQEGRRVTADFPHGRETLESAYFPVDEDSSWVLSRTSPDVFLAQLAETPEMVLNEQITKRGSTKIEIVAGHLRSLGVVDEKIAAWSEKINKMLATSTAYQRKKISKEKISKEKDAGEVIVFAKAVVKKLEDYVADVLKEAADSDERTDALRTCEEALNRSQLTPADDQIMRILLGEPADLTIPFWSFEATTIKQGLVNTLIEETTEAADKAMLAFLSPSDGSAKALAKARADKTEARDKEPSASAGDVESTSETTGMVAYQLELIADALKEIAETKSDESLISAKTLKRFLGRTPSVITTEPVLLLPPLFETHRAAQQLESANDEGTPKAKMAIAIQKSTGECVAEFEFLPQNFEQLIASTPVGTSAYALAFGSFLNQLPLTPTGPRGLYLLQVLRGIPNEIDIPSLWKGVTASTLAQDWGKSSDLLTKGITESPEAADLIRKSLRKEIDRLDETRLGIILRVHPDILGLVDNHVLSSALLRLVRSNQNVELMQALLAAPFEDEIKATTTKKIDQINEETEKSIQNADNKALEANQLVADKEAENAYLRSQLSKSSQSANEPTLAIQRNLTIEFLRSMIKEIKSLPPQEETAVSLLTDVGARFGLRVIGKTGEATLYEPTQFERIVESQSVSVEIIEPAFVYTDEGTEVVIEKGMVRDHE